MKQSIFINNSNSCITNDATKSGRIAWIDYVKGLAIILVLVAHGLSPDNWLNIWAYSFHLPVFFIISGLLLKPKTISGPIRSTVKKYAKSLLIPYYIFCALNFLVEICKDVLQKGFTTDTIVNNLSAFLLWRGLKADWFLPCLFLAIIWACLILKFINKKGAILVAGLMAAILCVFVPVTSFVLPVLMRAIVATFFVLVGYVFRGLLVKQEETMSINKKIICSVMFLIANLLLTLFNGKISLSAWNFGTSGLLFLLNGIVGSLFVIFLMRLMSRWNIRLLKYCGENSLIIMAIHMQVMALSGAVLEKFLPSGIILETAVILISLAATLVLVPFAKKLLPRKYKG